MNKKSVCFYAVVWVGVFAFPAILWGGSLDATAIKATSHDMVMTILDVVKYIGLIGGVGGGVAMVAFKLMNGSPDAWQMGMKIIGGGAILASITQFVDWAASL